VHGAANATVTVLAFFVPGGGGGVVKGLDMFDSLISGDSVIGVVGDQARDDMLDSVYDEYAKRASATFTNILARDWKYAGALENAHVRFMTQTGVAVGARTLSIYFAAEKVIKDGGEIGDAWKNLANQSPARNYDVNSIPDLQIPQHL
jgi:hypothetical protein